MFVNTGSYISTEHLHEYAHEYLKEHMHMDILDMIVSSGFLTLINVGLELETAVSEVRSATFKLINRT